MKQKSFKPLKCPNDEIDIKSLSYPLLASIKLDGCRLLIKEGQLCTCSLKDLPNKQLRDKFEPLRKFTEDNNCILDGEVFAPGIPFQFIVSCFMTENCFSKTAIKKWEKLCEEHKFYRSREDVLKELKFYCFDYLGMFGPSEPFILRKDTVAGLMSVFQNIVNIVQHITVANSIEVENYFEEVLKNGYEGLILRNPDGKYKYGRCTVKENIAFKLKPWVTIDSKIIGFVQATKVNKDVEKTTNELGYSRTSKKQGDRHFIEKAQAFIVDYEGKELSVPIAMTDEQKEHIWKHPEEYLGKYVEYKFMTVGMKEGGLPRIPKMIRMRLDKEKE